VRLHRGLQTAIIPSSSASEIVAASKEGCPATRKKERWWRTLFLNWHHFALVVIYVWFGSLKLAGLSPAQSLIEQTLPIASQGTLTFLFGVWEVAIGVALLHPQLAKGALYALFFHLFVTTVPLFLRPELCFDFPLVPNLAGQYIVKNLILIGAALETRRALLYRRH